MDPGTPAASAYESETGQLALLVDQATEYAIFMMDVDGCIKTWNTGAQRLKGYTRDEIVGEHFSRFYTDEDRARDHPANELRIAAREGRYEEEGWRIRKDGTRFWANVLITALRDERGELIGFGKVSRDLTSRRDAEEALRARAAELETANEELREYRRLVSSVRDYAIFMLSPTGQIRSWNAGAEHLKGYAPKEIIGRHFSTFYTAPDRERDHPGYELEVAAREGRYEEEGWRVRKDGSQFWASVTITAIRDDEGQLTGFAKVTRDLTERKRGEEELRGAVEALRAANAELDRFASVAAHDMTDPLRTISGFAELIVETEPSEQEVKEYTRHILDSSLRLSGMLQGLLTYARAGRSTAVAKGAVDLATVVAEALGDLSASVGDRDACVSVDLPAGAAVAVDGDDLRVILQNLIANALKFGAPERPDVVISAERADEMWRITVEDNGAGIPDEQRERIFDAFERGVAPSGRTGYGLGLAICHRLVDHYGGSIAVENASPHGARLGFTLPAGAEA